MVLFRRFKTFFWVYNNWAAGPLKLKSLRHTQLPQVYHYHLEPHERYPPDLGGFSMAAKLGSGDLAFSTSHGGWFFMNLSTTSGPFWFIHLSSSVVLEVCKTWLRVATPLLYRVVILRSTARARVLCRALREEKQLGGLIKVSRVENQCGTSSL